MTNYEEIWKMLDKHRFVVNAEISVFVTCIICNNLLNNASLGPCGCKYCFKCIVAHLESGDKFCPGPTTECRIEELSIESNICKDAGANCNVSRLEVECPSESCNYKCQVMRMADHLRVCDKKLTPCPFSEMGCPLKELQSENLLDHSLKEIYQHSKLMMAWLMNMRNEMISIVVHKQQERAQSALHNMEEAIDLKISQALRDNEQERRKREGVVHDLEKELRDVTGRNHDLSRSINEFKAKFSAD